MSHSIHMSSIQINTKILIWSGVLHYVRLKIDAAWVLFSRALTSRALKALKGPSYLAPLLIVIMYLSVSVIRYSEFLSPWTFSSWVDFYFIVGGGVICPNVESCLLASLVDNNYWSFPVKSTLELGSGCIQGPFGIGEDCSWRLQRRDK